ncbi:hypothetical protein L596_014654 [Steinernema carpocapsae]|uniref:Receptor-mediated endocytosis protein 6 n=1 Tax=Steinernema carpocapsae TaxID=34508 RepID=A0A4U5NDF9_STECR|nr:hypothetical protein L596_014654 [Steinernema carpocapsae]
MDLGASAATNNGGVPTGASSSLAALSENLKAERLVVRSEIEGLQQLHTSISEEFDNLAKITWISRHAQLIFGRLLNSDPTVSPENCCQWMMRLEEASFVDAHYRLGHHYATFVAIFDLFRKSPKSVAEWLNAVESLPEAEDMARCMYNVIYGSCIYPHDERCVLEMMTHLVELQLATTAVPDPRRVLRRGSTALCRIYKLFTEGLLQWKVFLTAALHDPIMYLLSQDEFFLDIEPSKCALHFSAEERRRRFGEDETSFRYLTKLSEHREMIVTTLKEIAKKFIDGILVAMSSFPASLAWLVRNLHSTLLEKKCVSREEAALICIDLIFTNLICPSVTNPEPMGIISDTPVANIARFNLMQVGQILQTLALSPYEQPPAHLNEFYNFFDKVAMSSIVTTILDTELDSISEILPNSVSDSEGSEVFERKAYLCSINQVNIMKACITPNVISQISDPNISEPLLVHVNRLPNGKFETSVASSMNCSSGDGSPDVSIADGSPSHATKLKRFAGKVQNAAAQSRQRFMNSPSRSSLSKIDDADKPQDRLDHFNGVDIPDIEVLVFKSESILPTEGSLGILTEEKFMESFESRKQRKSDGRSEKKTRFLTTTTESVISDRTTDVVSDVEDEDNGDERGSMCSSLDEADALQNADEAREGSRNPADEEEDISTLPDDNFSDGLSARGSPSVSGRDTPFSGAGNANDQRDDDGMNVSSTVGGEDEANQRVGIPSVPVTVRRPNGPEGLEEKFGKFGIPSQQDNRARYRDETHSLVSDSWSTDVVASDNEGAGSDALNQNVAAAVAAVFPPAAPNIVGVINDRSRSYRMANGTISLALEDRSDTWSLDATASDSEVDGSANLLADESSSQQSAAPPSTSQVAPSAHRSTVSESPSNPLSVEPAAPAIVADPNPGAPGPSGLAQPVSRESLQANQDRIRRQSSGSSFYSRSDVDSEFSRELNDDFPNGARRSVGDVGETSAEGAGVIFSVAGDNANKRSTNRSPVSPPNGDLGQNPNINSDSPGSLLSRRKINLFQGLQKVGKSIKRNRDITVNSLRQTISHSQTMGELSRRLPTITNGLSSMGVGPSTSQACQPSRMSSSRSDGRLSDLSEIDQQSAEDVLNKYRTQKRVETTSSVEPLAVQPEEVEEEELMPYYDPANISNCRAFVDAKRKLRLVLSSVGNCPFISNSRKENQSRERFELMEYLKLLLAESINARDTTLTAQIREVLRCLAVFDDVGVLKLMRVLRDEVRKRTSYVLYLQQSKLTLLQLRSHLQRAITRIEREQWLTSECLVDVLVRFYLQRHDPYVKKFVKDFRSAKAHDEKCELLANAVSSLRNGTDPIWRYASAERMRYAEISLERSLIVNVYVPALFPNGEADACRDKVFYTSIQKLASSITPDHRELRIPKAFRGECPWPAAQAEISIINAYKAPKDKMGCVVRCCETIQNLIGLSQTTVNCDDITPIIVYILIQANPPALLSNMQFIAGFHTDRMEGEEAYWWAQFSSAVEFIKTLLSKHF